MHDVFAIYDNDILPMLIMIIINIIILDFIQIRHTDDFPSTGTRLVDKNAICQKFSVPVSGSAGVCLCHTASSPK